MLMVTENPCRRKQNRDCEREAAIYSRRAGADDACPFFCMWLSILRGNTFSCYKELLLWRVPKIGIFLFKNRENSFIIFLLVDILFLQYPGYEVNGAAYIKVSETAREGAFSAPPAYLGRGRASAGCVSCRIHLQPEYSEIMDAHIEHKRKHVGGISL